MLLFQHLKSNKITEIIKGQPVLIRFENDNKCYWYDDDIKIGDEVYVIYENKGTMYIHSYILSIYKSQNNAIKNNLRHRKF